MIFGALSEKDVEGISRILENENISFEVIKDEQISMSNKDSLSNNLRYLHGPDLSNNLLAIEIETDLCALSNKAKRELLEYGITDEVPEEFQKASFDEAMPNHVDLNTGKKKIVGLTYGLSILLGLIVLLISYLKAM